MATAIEAAKRADPHPNPRVGAVIVRDRAIVSIGWHARAGGAHAESVAIQVAGDRARGSTLYVTLEPCNHLGRTPPCVDAILAAGLVRVVVACRDPNPRVRGGGIERLRREGIEVTVGVESEAAWRLVAAWARAQG
jgi:diaminohydroxyphosphoribosylaminopyrimidine deaminase/5-amino-6-(5-phosphoribosylamino)uracil reductase